MNSIDSLMLKYGSLVFWERTKQLIRSQQDKGGGSLSHGKTQKTHGIRKAATRHLVN